MAVQEVPKGPKRNDRDGQQFAIELPTHTTPSELRHKYAADDIQTMVGSKFEPVDLENTPVVDSGLPPELWTIVQSAPASFPPQYFLDVSRNLLENPNLTASHLSRAELSYTSFTDASYNAEAAHPHELASIIKHLKTDHQPRLVPGGVSGYKLQWTVVRKLIPRNPKLDEALQQTCHLYTSTEQVVVPGESSSSSKFDAERYLVIYIPHVSDADSIPFYHPKVRGVAILYSYHKQPPPDAAPGTLSLYYDLFPGRPLENRMSRTALKMLETIHKHARGRMQGYQKRVHHDLIIPQKTFQDTYAYLKGMYAKELIDNWVEQTPANKHVFEDLGIAAFLIELWTDMYGGITPESDHRSSNTNPTDAEKAQLELQTLRRTMAQQTFPGFVDIGCGNGLLVYILNKEGWKGWGFDARRRKTWATFGEVYQQHVKEMLLVPSVLQNPEVDREAGNGSPPWHNGLLPKGNFIISNHADELTAWTPVLAYLSDSPFIAIPCCSHNFGGTRFRAPYRREHFPSATTNSAKQVSAYMSLCSYVAHLCAAMSFVPEKEHLRIPSTRNIAIIGRKRDGDEDKGSQEDRLKFIRKVVEKEMGGETSIEQVRLQWLKRGSGLIKPGSVGH
ncbi:tRNA(Ser) Um(44) 2'-O-methyltransferase [Paraconiothyrium brasiliense]|uniref:tRNA (uracil-O(2)-)-methyltransferase n=1 Tax=Paraconiothyrium brasiliense TaxID=300254 RepID=A0ABR3RQE3_9PLEO